MSKTLHSWGNYPPVTYQKEHALRWRSDTLPSHKTLLPFGKGRSYGDVLLNTKGTVITTKHLNHFIEFDQESGTITCESGVTLAEVMALTVPHGWILPVTPGTKFVSVGGAIANDVHGKNHHQAGSFGCHILQFELLRSDNTRLICSPSQNPDLFAATIGGLGLTGLITWVQIQLKKIHGPYIDTESIKMSSLDEFFALSQESFKKYEYTVSWVDTSRTKKNKLGRGLFMRANHNNTHDFPTDKVPVAKPLFTMPITAPNWFINIGLIKAFNFLYYHRQFSTHVHATQYFDPFFYPLDVIQNWNRLYGKRGFRSYQCVVPMQDSKEVIRELLYVISQAGLASPLTVLKLFGEKKSPGLLSFPRSGANLLLDFPNIGPRLTETFQTLDNIVAKANGKIYPAKDTHMTPQHFQTFYPEWKKVESLRDPLFMSDFWRRVTGQE